MNANIRKGHFCEVMALVTKHRENQWAAREYTWGGLEIDATSVGETIGAIVVGTKGHGQRGQQEGNSKTKRPDFINGMEHKSGDRAYPNLDFQLSGKIVQFDESLQFIKLDTTKISPGTLEQLDPRIGGIHRSIQGAAASIQLLEEIDGKCYGTPKMGKTRKKMFFRVEGQGCSLHLWNPELDGGNGDYEEKEWADFLPSEYLNQLTRENQGDARITDICKNRKTMTQHLDSKNINYRLNAGRYIQMSKNIDFEKDVEFDFVLRQDDGHWNLGTTSRKQMKKMLEKGIVLTHHHHDLRGRVVVAVFLLRAGDGGLGDVPDVWNNEDSHKPQINIRLFEDFERGSLYSGRWGAGNIGAELLAYGVQTSKGFEVKHWKPNGGSDCKLTNSKINSLLVDDPEPNVSMPIHPSTWDEVIPDGKKYDRNNAEHRQWLAEKYFRECAVGFYRKMRRFLVLYNTPKNVGFGYIGENMSLIWFGLRGSRTNARGADVYENDGGISEVKTATGIPDDYMDTRGDAQPFHFGDNVTKLQNQRRIFINRVVDFKEKKDGKFTGHLRLVLLVANEKSMHQFHKGIVNFFSNTSNLANRQGAESAAGRIDIQYHMVDFNQSHILPENKKIELVRVVEFNEHEIEGKTINIVNDNPTVPPQKCKCPYCKKGIFHWDPLYDKAKYANKKAWIRQRKFKISKKKIY
jgi:hypothetical protein